MPSCSASESDSKIRPANFQTRHKPPVRNYRRIQSRPADPAAPTRPPPPTPPFFTSSPTFHRPWTNRISKYSISFSGHSRANPFGPDFERYKTLQKHRLDREADYASFPSSAATDCASSERIRTCTRSSETILLRSWIATVADCVSFSGLFFRIRSINC